MPLSRRNLLKSGLAGTASLALTPLSGWASFIPRRDDGLRFEPFPHPGMPELKFAYATDPDGNPFRTLGVEQGRIGTPSDLSQRFGVNARWYVEGFGFVWLEADNDGRHFSLSEPQERSLNLNFEFARTRVRINSERMARFGAAGTSFSTEVRHLHALSQQLLEDAAKATAAGQAGLADKSLLYALWAAERLELENAHHAISGQQRSDHVYFGCETRQYIWAKSEPFVDRFTDVFNYATVTHYVWDSWYEVFEPEEGKHRWGIKDNIVDWLTENNVTIEGRPLFWFHGVVTPDWLKNKSFDELKGYVDRHTEALVGHYGDRISHWEVVNEYHDWANIHNHTPEQITEITRQACEKTHEVNPDIVRIINNCCPFGNYVSYRYNSEGPADRPLRTPHQFVRDIVDAGVPFEVVGVQMYFPQRDLQQIIRLVERFEQFGKPVQITEIGATSGPTTETVRAGDMKLQDHLYDWRRPWDEDLQADWLEELYTLFYSKPWIEAINWYDFADFRTFIRNGGLVREDLSTKQSYDRLHNLLGRWNRLPSP
ncbi:MAG TPA: endo-1,4-beta-xylanase [Rhodothermales bacterium]|nr:endo-1,4-beta-xylanase [Rhodothermales bacterium]